MRLEKRTIWVLGIGGLAIILVVLGFVYHSPTTTESPEASIGLVSAEETSVLGQVLREELSERDQDNDGLRDWEESLWDTDPNNPDTDGDGVRDGDEVDENRDPTVSGPGDTRETSVTQPSSASTEPTTAIDAYARQFFVDYLTLRESGQLSDPSGRNFLFRQLQNQVPFIEVTQYTAEDILTVPTNKETIREYSNALGAIILTATYEGNDSPLIILENILVRGQTEQLATLEEIQTTLTHSIPAIADIRVPNEIASIHLRFLNETANIAAALAELQNVHQDALAGFAGFQLYQTSSEEMTRALVDIRDYLTEKEIRFSDGEAGLFFMQLTS